MDRGGSVVSFNVIKIVLTLQITFLQGLKIYQKLYFYGLFSLQFFISFSWVKEKHPENFLRHSLMYNLHFCLKILFII